MKRSGWSGHRHAGRAARRPRRIIDFDELFTAPVGGFDSARQYYRACTAEPVIPRINVPTLILSAKNDPLIPPNTLEQLTRPGCVKLHIAEGGGHLGYISRNGTDPDRYWMDWRVIDWLTANERAIAVA